MVRAKATVPVPSSAHDFQVIQGFSGACRAPHFQEYSDFFEEVYARKWQYLADLNIYLIKHISSFLGIRRTNFKRLSELGIENPDPTQRLIDICEAVGASRYIIGTRAREYMDEALWSKTSVKLEYFEPQYPLYPQLWGKFLDNCAIFHNTPIKNLY